MAFGFIKKVFSFGRKDEQPAPAPVVEETLPAPVPPDVPEFLKRNDDEAQSDAAALVESPADPIPAAPVEAAPEAEVLRAPELAPLPAPEPDPVFEAPAPVPKPEALPEPEALAPRHIVVPKPEPAPETPPPAAPAEPAPVSEAPVAPVDLPEPAPAPAISESMPQPEPAPAPPQAIEPAPIQSPPPELPAFLAAPPAPVAPPAPAAPVAGKVLVGRAIEAKREEVAAPAVEERKSWFHRLREGLSRSSRELTGGIAGIFTKRKLDEETLEELEEVLLRADLGMETAIRVTDALSSSRYGKDVSDTEVRAIMAQEIEKVLRHVAVPLELDLSHKPHVILVVGVNGTGKTTTIGKLAAKLTSGGLSVMLAAGDTFRAAAIEQLKIWGERTGSPVVASKIGADAAGLAWDAFEKAKAAGSDVLIIDTAGRLQNRTELMAELEKIVRVLGKHDPEAPHTVLQTVDATTGQNALNQVEIFRNIAGVNGLVMTKLDGTARGGILVAIAAKHKLPVYFIGVGEQVDDLEPFSASDFAKAIAGVA